MGARILVVDDEAPFTRMLKLVLELQDYTVVTASTAGDAIRAVSAQPFDLVLTDMKLETDTAGYEVVRAARAVKHPPAVIILTAFPLLAHEWRAAGAAAAIAKPSQMGPLLQLLSELLETRAQALPHTAGS
jgi:CheY-like chemotaxis protein